jgi:hypothetical protein
MVGTTTSAFAAGQHRAQSRNALIGGAQQTVVEVRDETCTGACRGSRAGVPAKEEAWNWRWRRLTFGIGAAGPGKISTEQVCMIDLFCVLPAAAVTMFRLTQLVLMGATKRGAYGTRYVRCPIRVHSVSCAVPWWPPL